MVTAREELFFRTRKAPTTTREVFLTRGPGNDRVLPALARPPNPSAATRPGRQRLQTFPTL